MVNARDGVLYGGCHLEPNKSFYEKDELRLARLRTLNVTQFFCVDRQAFA